jgi:hypothetical protein
MIMSNTERDDDSAISADQVRRALIDFNEQLDDLISINECNFEEKTIEIIRRVLIHVKQVEELVSKGN